MRKTCHNLLAGSKRACNLKVLGRPLFFEASGPLMGARKRNARPTLFKNVEGSSQA
jgi:hypothetical protein